MEPTNGDDSGQYLARSEGPMMAVAGIGLVLAQWWRLSAEQIALIDFLFNELLVALIVVVLMAKAVVLRRESLLGKALAVNNVAFSVAYVGILLAPWFPFFRTETWEWVLRVGIFITASGVLFEMQRAFGGWRAFGREIVDGIVDAVVPRRVRAWMLKRRLARLRRNRDREGY